MVTWKTDVETAYIVLIISDQPETAASWNTLFTQRNCIVLVESEVSDAIQSARLIDPSLVVIDVQLPKAERAVADPRRLPPGRLEELCVIGSDDERDIGIREHARVVR